MPIAKKRTATPPTIEQRLNSIAAKREAALSVFREAVTDLDEAAQEADTLIAYVDSEVARLSTLREAALDERADADIKGANLRTLLGA